MVTAFESVGMDYSELFVEDDTTASLFIQILEFVFGFHVLTGEVAFVELEVYAIVA